MKTITAIVMVFSCLIANAQRPVSNFTGSPLSGCSPLIVVFQDMSTGNPTSWAWDFGNGNTSTLQNPTATYFTPGTYTITLITRNAAGTNTLTRSNYITVYEPPTLNFSANTTSGCFPLNVQFTDLSTAGLGNSNVSWQWDFGNGVTSTQQNPNAVYTTSGTFTVTLRVTNDKGCVKTISRPAYINVTNGVTAVFTNTQPTVCSAPAAISFTNNSTGPPVMSYLWDFGDGNFSTALNPTHTYLTSGSFVVTLTATSTAGCQATVSSAPIVIGGYTTSFDGPPAVCTNEVATFTNTSSPVPISSSWTFGDGGVGTGINSSYSYANPGVYTIWLYNTYSNCIDSTSRSITVNPRPVANFSAPVTSRCEPPLTVNFTDLTTGGAVSWQWDFGDGGTSTLQNPSHIYTAYGDYNVTLIATNNFGCTDTIVVPAFVRIRRAVISFAGLPARGCIPFTVSPTAIINSVDAVTSYQWDFGDGSPLDPSPTPTHTYPLQGTYTVTLTITTSSGCTDTYTMPTAVRTGSKPIADFTAAPIPVCATEVIQFTDLSTPSTVDEWEWDFGDGGSSLLQNPGHRYNDTGYFTVRLIATNNGCPDTIIKTNYVRVLPPIARFGITPDCGSRLRFIFTDQSIVDPLMTPLSWEWNFGDASPLVTTQSPIHSFPTLGVYNVRLVVFNGSCSDTIFRTVNVIDENPDFVADRVVACKVATLNFTVSNINPANVATYLWDFGDGGTASVAAPAVSYTYNLSGTYSVRLILVDINGCRDTVLKTNYVRINGPVSNFNATNVAGCIGLVTTFNDLSTTDGSNALVSWQFNFGDGVVQTFAGPSFQHTYTTEGNFSVQLIVTDAAGCQDSLTLANIINATNPIPDFTSPDILSCPGAVVNFVNTSTPSPFTSLWDFGDGGTSTGTSPAYIYSATGIYDVTLTIEDPFGCIATITKPAFITVDEPVASFTVSDSTSSCAPLEVQFTNTSTFFTAVRWDFGAGQGNSTLTNPVHYYSTPGTYTVMLIAVSPGGCEDTAYRTIRLYDTTGSIVNYIPFNGCKPLDVDLNVFTPGPMRSFYWDFGDGYTEITTTPNINHIYSSFGNFLPKVIMEDPSGCLIPLQGIDTVFVTGANAKFGYSDSVFCDRGTVNFSDSTTFNDPVISYSWLFGDGGASTLQNPAYSYTTPGLYTVQLAIETQLGCRDTLTKPALIQIVQRPLIDIGGDTVICVNSQLLHSGVFLQPDTSIVTWEWNFPNGASSLVQNPSAQVYTAAGTFTVTAIATNSTGCKNTTVQQILVNPLPVITLPAQLTIQAGFPQLIPAQYSPNTISWLWTPAVGLSCINCATPEASPKFNTWYQVFATDTEGCSSIGSVEVIVICANSNIFIPNTFSPNGDGSNDAFYPRGRGLDRVRSLRIFNRWGEVLFERSNFPVNDAPSGWDGMYKGKKAQADVYVYQAEVYCENGDIIKLNGNIALIL